MREQQATPIEEAVYRLTGKTALIHCITDRGFIAAGKVADITIYYSIDLMSAEKVGKP